MELETAVEERALGFVGAYKYYNAEHSSRFLVLKRIPTFTKIRMIFLSWTRVLTTGILHCSG